jgi:hypothetical protein
MTPVCGVDTLTLPLARERRRRTPSVVRDGRGRRWIEEGRETNLPHAMSGPVTEQRGDDDRTDR